MVDGKMIPLTRGLFAIIDEEDYERVSRFSWYANVKKNGVYAEAHVTIDGKRTHLSMHRFVMDAPKGKNVDHREGRTLDNRKGSLRFATGQQNNQSRDATSQLKGVKRVGRRWAATIHLDGKPIHVGVYDTAELAALAYDAKAREIFGEFARLNFPDRNETPALVREGLRPSSTSGYLGVTWNKQHGSWRAQITMDGKRTHLGYFETSIDAAYAFDHYARIAFGNSARLNFPDNPDILPERRRSRTGPKSTL